MNKCICCKIRRIIKRINSKLKHKTPRQIYKQKYDKERNARPEIKKMRHLRYLKLKKEQEKNK